MDWKEDPGCNDFVGPLPPPGMFDDFAEDLNAQLFLTTCKQQETKT